MQRKFRMAYCGTVTMHDAEGKALHTIRYGSMPESGADELVTSLASDVVALRTQRSDLAVMKLCDGAAEMWGLLDAEFDEETFGTTRRRWRSSAAWDGAPLVAVSGRAADHRR